MATLGQASLSVQFLPTAFPYSVSLCHILVVLPIFQNFFIIILFVMMVCDQLSLMLILQKDYDSLKAQMIAFLAIKYFQIKVCIHSFKNIMLFHT